MSLQMGLSIQVSKFISTISFCIGMKVYCLFTVKNNTRTPERESQ